MILPFLDSVSLLLLSSIPDSGEVVDCLSTSLVSLKILIAFLDGLGLFDFSILITNSGLFSSLEGDFKLLVGDTG